MGKNQKATVFVAYEAGQAIIDALAPGMILKLEREPLNEKDPNAVQVFLDDKGIGYLANSPKTLIKGTRTAASVSADLARANVAGCYAKLVKPHLYGEKNERVRWEAELFWIPVWEQGEKTKDEPITVKVGGSKVTNSRIIEVMNDIDSFKGGKLIVKMFDYGGTGDAGPVPTIWVKGEETVRGAAPAGRVVDPPQELIAALNVSGSFSVEPVKVLSGGNYKAQITLERDDMSEYYPDMEDVIKRGIMQARDVRERVEYMMGQIVPSSIIHGVLKALKANETGISVVRPRQLFLQTAENNYLTRSLGYHLAGKNIRLVGEKGSGKNTLVYTVCWVMNKALCRIQGNADMDKIDLTGGQVLDDHGTHFELPTFLQMLEKGGDVVLDEINSVKPEIAIILHSLADDARSIEVPGYGLVHVHDDARIWATMNEAYIGTGDLNTATADRFVPLYLADQMNLGALLTEMVPGANPDDIKVCVTLYEKIRKAVRDGKCSVEGVTTRGYIDALEAAKLLPMRDALMDNIAGRPQEPETRQAIADHIRAIFPA